MLRTILGYAVLAVLAFFLLKLVLAILGVALGLFFNLLWLAALGFVAYLLLKLISPNTARRVHETITGRRAA